MFTSELPTGQGFAGLAPVVNLAPSLRRQRKDGREYVVAPLVLLREQVLHGSKGPLFYPRTEIARNAAAWNNVPLVAGHPSENGVNVSAGSPGVLDRFGIGHVRNARCEADGTLKAEGWFDIEKTTKVSPRILLNLQAGNPIELSTGLYTENEVAMPGASHNGVRYSHVARRFRPDHVAILQDVRGACSLRDGCGVNAPAVNSGPFSIEGAMRLLNPSFRLPVKESVMNDFDPDDVLLVPELIDDDAEVANAKPKRSPKAASDDDENLLMPELEY